MRIRIVLTSFLSLFYLINVVAQQTENIVFSPGLAGSNSWKYSPDLTEEQLYQYDRLLYMSKEDWEMFRADPRYDDRRVREIYNENKGKVKLGQGSSRGGGGAEECNCWVEPDNSYTNSDPNNWPNCAGGGPGVDCWIGPINLPFSFCFYGQDFNQIALTSKGTIVFGPAGYIDWTPSEFPTPTNGEPQYDHVCGFWADFDFRATGELLYKVTSNAFYLNYIDVGYFANHDNLANTFQVILTATDAGILPEGNNVQLCYRDMQWAHGDVGGSSGFSGPTPANVGADRVTGTNHVQFGRFNLNNANYNGPYGQTAGQQDGINWLDNKELNFNTCLSSANIPPISTASAPCGTIYLCQGQTYNLNMQFLSPETGQQTTITTSQSGTGLTASAQNGNTATLTASFTAGPSNIGTNTVTITATDNGSPAATTTLTYIIEVTPDIPPAISIDGLLGICAGGNTLLTATAGFDSYSWSTGCNTQECLVSQGGNVTVTGYSGVCSNTATVFVDATAYFIPDFVGGNQPIELCPGIIAEVCLEEEWESYSWDVYTGYEGTIPNGAVTDQQCFEFSGNYPGFYAVLVTDENGCQGLNIQEISQIESFVDEANEDLSGAYCEGLTPVEFIGGYSNPASGSLIVYAQDGSSSGWQGSYLNVVITHTDGTTDTYLFTATSTFTVYNAPITLGDTWVFTYVSNGNPAQDANNSFWALNCNGEIYQSGMGLAEGVVYTGVSSCAPSALSGTWTVTGPAGWSLTSTSVYNPVNNAGVSSPNIFTPGGYGLYTLCFTDPECDIDHCYELEYTEAPTLSLTPNADALLCGNESLNLSISITDVGGTGDITWSGTGLNVASNELSATAGPYTGYVTTNINVEIENGCGSANDSFEMIHHPDVPQPALTDPAICQGASTVLDPIPAGQDNNNLEYVWTPGNSSGSTLTVNAPGTYCVTVSNLCGTSQQECATVTNVVAANAPALDPDILECNADQVQLSTTVPPGYSIAWSNGVLNNSSITVTFSNQYCFTITDNFGCNTTQQSCSDVVITQVPTTFAGDGEVIILCPTECKILDLQATDATSFEWEISCEALEVTAGNSGTFQICSDLVPTDCQPVPIIITGTAENACGSASTTYEVLANACGIRVPNVITPNGDQYNANFVIEGLENYPGSRLMIFDRNGALLYESDDYANNWGPRDLSTGTYYYILELPFGTTTLFEGHFTILK